MYVGSGGVHVMGRRFRVTTYSGNVYDFEIEEKNDRIYIKPVEGSDELEARVEKIDDENFIVYIGHEKFKVSLSGETIFIDGEPALVTNIVELLPVGVEARRETSKTVTVTRKGEIRAPLSGKIDTIKVKKGDRVKEGDVVALMVSMKMVVEIKSDVEGVVEEIYVEPGKAVKAGDLIMKIKPSKKT